MKNISIILACMLTALVGFAQNENALIRNGNKLYRQNSFEQSLNEYQHAVTQAPGNPLARYNLGNALFRSNKLDEALESYESTIASGSQPVKEKAFYNEGVTFSKQQKLQQSIDAWKNALKLDPADQEARENLQKALLEQKKQQQKDDKEDKKDKKKKDKKEQDKKQQQQPQPKQPQSRLNKKQVDQLLKALAQKEKEVQQKMQANNSSPNHQEKDW